jgi:tetratricopeptide (TPR) repeat protein
VTSTNRFVICVTVLLAWLSRAPAAQTQTASSLSRSWKELHTASFTVMGDAPESVLSNARAEIDAFRASVRQLFPRLPIDGPVPMMVVIFKDDIEFTRFKPRDSRGRPMGNVGGYFTSRPDANFIVFASTTDSFNYRTIFHEYTHYLLHRSGQRLPVWLDEGVAEFFSTFTRRYQGKTVLGRASGDSLSALKDRTFIPLRTIVSPSSSELEKMWRSPGWISQFYAESWALTHYLIIKRQTSLSGYLDALSNGRSQDEAFRQGFGVDLETLDRELRDYVHGYLFSAILYDPVDDSSQPVAASRMREAGVHELLGRLLLDHGALDEADREVQAALMLDEADVNARVGLARIRMGQGRTDDAIAILEAISKAAPSSLPAQYYLGVALASAWRHADALAAYDRALAINKMVPATWMGVSASALALGRDSQANASLQQALLVESDPARYRTHALNAFAMGRDLVAGAATRSYLERTSLGEESAQYAAFLGALAYLRAGKSEEADKILQSAQDAIDPKTWQGEVVQYLRGQTTGEQLLTAARDVGQQTEAHTYIGFKESIAGKDADARQHFSWVIERGSRNYVEYTMVKRELDRLAHAVSTEQPAAAR